MIRSLRTPLLAGSLLVAMAAPALPSVAFAQTAPVDQTDGDPSIGELERWLVSLEANPGSVDLGDVKSRLGQIGDKFKQKVDDAKRQRGVIKSLEQQIKTLHDQAKDIRNKLKDKALDQATRDRLQHDLASVRGQIGEARNKLKDTVKDAQGELRDAHRAKALVQRTSALANRLLQKAKKGGSPSPAAIQSLLGDIAKLIAALAEPPPIPPPSPAALDASGE